MNQKEQVLIHLHTHGSITSWEAIDKYRITRLSAVIGFLKDDKVNIDNSETRTTNGKSYTVYKLITKPQTEMF